MRKAQRKQPAPKKATLSLLRRRRDASKEKMIGCVTELREILHSAVSKFDRCADDYERDQAAFNSFMMQKVRQQ